ncbi:MAG: SurA N-terminal domain-containing protein [Candidatus Taylorbacteria bacterium]
MQEQKKSSLVVTLLIILIVAVLAVGGYLIFGSNIKGLSMGDKTATSTLFTSGTTANVATVNGVAITKAIYDSAFTSTIASYQAQGIQATSSDDLAKVRTQVLDGLIGNELLTQALTASKMAVTPAEVETEYQALVTQSGGVEGFKAALTKNNLTDAQLRINIEKQILTRKFLLSNIDTKSTTVTDAEIAKFYAEYSASQKASGNKSVPAMKDLSAQIKQQLTGDKEQALINKFIATLRASADVVITQ